MRLFIVVILVGLLVFSLLACGSNDGQGQVPNVKDIFNTPDGTRDIKVAPTPDYSDLGTIGVERPAHDDVVIEEPAPVTNEPALEVDEPVVSPNPGKGKGHNK